MDSLASVTWYQANWQYLQIAVNQIRQQLENHIAVAPNQSIRPQFQQTLAPDALALLEQFPPAVEQLCRLFSLSPFERYVLLLCVGMELDQELEHLCAKIHGNAQRNYPTFNLALSTFSHAHFSVLSAQSPLQHWHLLEIDRAQTFAQSPIRTNRRILCYILGEPALDQELAGILFSVPPNPSISLPPSYQAIADQVTATWSQSLATTQYPVIQLCGSDVETKESIAIASCQSLGWNLLTISASALPPHPDALYQLLQRCLREALMSNSFLFIQGDAIHPTEPRQGWVITQVLEQLTVPLMLSTQERHPQSHRSILTFDVGSLTHKEQCDVWNACLGPLTTELNGQINALVAQFNLSPVTIRAACSALQNTHPKCNETDESQGCEQTFRLKNQLWNFCKVQARPRLEDLAQRINPAATFEDLILPEQQKTDLQQIIAQVRQRAKVYQEWGFAQKGERGLGVSALFSGASGTGKTMAAEVLAQELHLDLYRVDLSVVVSKYIGETEKNLRRIFDAAEAGGAVLLFDEADALFGKRTQVKDSHDRHANVEVSYLLQRMEAYQGLAILTTNLPDALDKAFMRRLNFAIKFPFPIAEARTKIWERVFPEMTPTQDLNMKKLGNLNVAGGNIRNIALNAAFLAAEAGEPVMMKHIAQAATSECLKLEQPLSSTELKGWVK